jgi:hypothetical protein
MVMHMSMKQQWKKIKENWLIIAVVLVLLVFFNVGGMGDVTQSFKAASYGSGANYEMADMAMESMAYMPSRSYSGNFAPEVEERKITKSASMTTEVEKGNFQSAEQQLRSILTTSDSFITNENINKFGTERKEYFQGNFQIKVETTKYEAVIGQLKTIGEVEAFNENTQDVTGTYVNKEINLQLEKERLQRYRSLYEEAEDVEDKLNLNDRIFNQERTVKYLEDALNRIDQKIEYSTIQFTLREEQSDYADVVWVKFSDLIESLVQSFNSVLSLLFTAIPWAILALVGWVIWRVVKRK